MLNWWTVLLIVIIFMLYFFWRYSRKRPSMIFKIRSRQATSKLFNRTRHYQQVDLQAIDAQQSEVTANQLRFDQVAELLFEHQIIQIEREHAEHIQHLFLSKMPASCSSQIGEYDLGEWSIYWNYKQQSLEYYVGRFGVFYTHVDRLGAEHHQKIKF